MPLLWRRALLLALLLPGLAGCQNNPVEQLGYDLTTPPEITADPMPTPHAGSPAPATPSSL